MTNVQIAQMLQALTAQMAQIAAQTAPPAPVVQTAAAKAWLPNIKVVIGDLLVHEIYNNRDDAFAARARLAANDAGGIYRVLPECRDDSGISCSVVTYRARDCVAA